MKKILLLGVLLFMVAPAMAATTVDITCSVDGNEVTVSYDNNDGNSIRAFGLDIEITSGDAVITKAEMVSTDYRIFPGQIVIEDGDVTDYGTPYDPCDLGDANLTVEMGSLYADDDPCKQDPPPDSGQLFKFWVTCNTTDSNFAITENTLRGGVVMEDPDEDPTVTLCIGEIICGFEPIDCGDAPDTYPTLLSSGGPSHVDTGPMLGAARDTETDGQPSVGAVDDDLNGATPDDEDGVTITTLVSPGSVTVNASAACVLNAWMDWNGDGDFADGGEQIFSNQALVAGDNVLAVTVPTGAKENLVYSRWRVNTAGGLSYTGPADDGEVEDHATECLKSTATGYSTWNTFGKPKCWCFRKQCRGDTNGAMQLGRPVSDADLTLFKSAFGMTSANLLAQNPGGICADLNHTSQLGRPVSDADLTIFKEYFGDANASVPECVPATVGVNFWTN